MNTETPLEKSEYLTFRPQAEDMAVHQFIQSQKPTNRPVVVVQGLGVVGSAMAAALFSAKNKDGEFVFSVLGVDLDSPSQRPKIDRANRGLPPVDSSDPDMAAAYQNSRLSKNFLATSSAQAYSHADVVIVDVNLDVDFSSKGRRKHEVTFDPFIRALQTIGNHITPSTLVLIETTVPPGTTEKIALPLLGKCLRQRGWKSEDLLLAHSYERVTPGPNYLKSITHFYRVFSGVNQKSNERTRQFLETFIDTKAFPLTRLDSPTASEMAKVLENSYRAMNIAFIQEWTEFAHLAKVNLHQVIGAIKKRPTHNNIMAPGIGVGGYCLPKDPLLADWALQELFDSKKGLESSVRATEINRTLPEFAAQFLQDSIGSLKQKKIALLGATYLAEIADTRNSPSLSFYRHTKSLGAELTVHDPILFQWDELPKDFERDLNSKRLQESDIVVFAVAHSYYRQLDSIQLCQYFPHAKVFYDANRVLSPRVIKDLKEQERKVLILGKGTP